MLEWKNACWLAGVFLATGLVLLATSQYGPGYNPDAVAALAAARNFLYKGILFDHVSLYVRWPPLFPVLQAGLGALGSDFSQAARWMNALSYGGIVAVMGNLIVRTTQARPARLLGIVSSVAAFPILRQAVEASTEPLFALLVLLFVVQGARCLKQPTWSQVGLLGCVTAAACLQRYAGIALLVCGGSLLLFRRFVDKLRWIPPTATDWKQAVYFSAGAACPLVVWLVRNAIVAGTLTGPRFVPNQTFLESLSALIEVVANWLIPLRSSVGITVGLVVAIGALLFLSGRSVPGAMGDGKDERLRRALQRTSGLVVGVYVLLIVVTGAIGASALPNRRLVMPAFAPSLLLATWAVDGVYVRLVEDGRQWAYRGLVLAHLAWALGMVVLVSLYVWVRADIGAGGYNTEVWQTSETAEWVRRHSLDKPVRSNEPHALYFLTSVPQRAPETGAVPRNERSHRDRFPTEGYYVVCFACVDRARFRPKMLFRKVSLLTGATERGNFEYARRSRSERPDCSQLVAPPVEVDTVARLTDGAVYEVGKAGPSISEAEE